MFSSAVRLRSSEGCWKTTPSSLRTFACSVARSRPAIRTWPDVGASVVVSTDTVVVFPAPLGPSRQKSWPAGTSKLMSSTALCRAARYRLTRWATSTAIMGISGGPAGIRVSQPAVARASLAPPGQPGERAGDGADQHDREIRRPHLRLEIAHEQRQAHQAGHPAGGRVLFGGHGRGGFQQLPHAQRRPGLHRDPGRLASGIGEVVHRARRHPHDVAGARDHPPATDPEPHPPREHRKALLLLRMSVAARHPPAGGEHQFPLEHAVTGRGEDGDPLTAERVLDEMAPDGQERCTAS